MRTDKPYIIAEVGNNHDGDYLKAKDMVHAANEAGASCIKFQCIDFKKWVSSDLKIFSRAKQTGYKTQLERLESVKLSLENYVSLAQLAKDVGIDFSCTIFDSYIFQELSPYLAFAKISSAEIYNKRTLDIFKGFQKPIVLSSGLSSSLSEIINVASYLNQRPYILHCVSRYPTTLKQSNLGNIRCLQAEFGVDHVGYSDHTIGLTSSIIALTLGCRIIEKHFKLDSEKGQEGDKPLSSTQSELSRLVEISDSIPMFTSNSDTSFVSNRDNNISWTQLVRKAHSHEFIKANTDITDDMCSYYVSGHGEYTSFDVESYPLRSSVDIEPGTPLSSENCTYHGPEGC